MTKKKTKEKMVKVSKFRAWNCAMEFLPYANHFFRYYAGGMTLYRVQAIQFDATHGTVLVFNDNFSRSLDEISTSMHHSVDLKHWERCGVED